MDEDKRKPENQKGKSPQRHREHRGKKEDQPISRDNEDS